jgi:hypothetical protein
MPNPTLFQIARTNPSASRSAGWMRSVSTFEIGTMAPSCYPGGIAVPPSRSAKMPNPRNVLCTNEPEQLS